MPLPISRIPDDFCSNLEYVFCDIDDTLTTDGLLTDDSYGAIWDLHRADVKVVPVTGRPAGWCDHIARMWPVDGVIGENGSFYFVYDRKARKMRREYFQSPEERERGKSGLARIREEVLREVPGCGIAADQAYRITDLAVDFCEDVEPLDDEAVDRICGIAKRNGAICKVSSIHVNCWFGDFDKVSCLKTFLLKETGAALAEMQGRILFVGDSPNDEPSFRELETSVGVANIAKFLPRLEHPPRYVTEKEGAEGFAEMAKTILDKRLRRTA